MAYRRTGVTPAEIREWLAEPGRTQVDAAAHFDVSINTIQSATNHRIGDTERETHAAIVDLIAEHGWPPSIRELSTVTQRGLQSTHLALAKLAHEGYIVKGPGPRMIRLTDKELE